jgi:hypothetical protein
MFQVNLWDLRTRKVVTEYHGMKNEYLRIPIHVDQSEEIVYGGKLSNINFDHFVYNLN